MGHQPDRLDPIKSGITCTRDFEIVEMDHLSPDDPRAQQFTTTTSYSVSTNPMPKRYSRQKSAGRNWVDSFKRVSGASQDDHRGYVMTEGMPIMDQGGYNLHAAAARTANSALVRDLKGRHLQMIAIGGSIGPYFSTSYVFYLQQLHKT